MSFFKRAESMRFLFVASLSIFASFQRRVMQQNSAIYLRLCATAGAKNFYSLTTNNANFSRGLDSKEIERTRLELVARNVPYIRSEQVSRFIERRQVPLLWLYELASAAHTRSKQCGLDRWAQAASGAKQSRSKAAIISLVETMHLLPPNVLRMFLFCCLPLFATL